MSAIAWLIWFCCFSGPGAEIQLRLKCIWCRSEPHCPGGLLLKGYPLAPLFVPPLRGSNLQEEEMSGEGLSHMTSDVKGQGVWTARSAIYWGRKGYPGDEVLVFPVLPLVRCLRLSAPVICHTWPNAFTLLMPSCLLQSHTYFYRKQLLLRYL